MRFLPGNAQHIGARHSQQDSFGFADPDDAAFISHGGFLAVVCDGMGGMEHGDAASRTAVRVFLDAYARKTPQESVPAALDRSVREANAYVVALAHSLGLAEGIGTTLVGATLLNGAPGQARLYWVSVGDSGLFHVSGGQMRMVNHPHVFANHLDAAVARGTISVEAALTHPERDSLTSFIGTEVLEEVDLTLEPMILADGDAILLASDGMFKTLTPAESAACLVEGQPQSWAETLVYQTLARQRESQDNVTVLSVSVEPERAPVPASASHALPAAFVEQGQTARTVALPAHVPEPLPAFGPPAPPPPAPAAPSSLAATSMGIAVPAMAGPPATAPASPPANWPPPGTAPPFLPQAPPQPSPSLGFPSPPYPPSPSPAFQAMPGAAGPGMQPSSRGHGWLWILLVVLFLGAGGAGWWYWSTHYANQTPRRIRSAEPAGQVKAPPRDPSLPIPPPDPRAPVEPQPSGKTGIKETAPR